LSLTANHKRSPEVFLQSQIKRFIKRYDSANDLLIVYYVSVVVTLKESIPSLLTHVAIPSSPAMAPLMLRNSLSTSMRKSSPE